MINHSAHHIPLATAPSRSAGARARLVGACMAGLVGASTPGTLAQSTERSVLLRDLNIQPASLFGLDARTLRLLDDGRSRRDLPTPRVVAIAPAHWADANAAGHASASAAVSIPASSPDATRLSLAGTAPTANAGVRRIDTPGSPASVLQAAGASLDGYLETVDGSWLFGFLAGPAEPKPGTPTDPADTAQPNDQPLNQPPPETEADGQTVYFNSRRLGTLALPIDRVRTIWLSGPATPNETPVRVDPASLDADGADVVLLRTGERLVGFLESIDNLRVVIDDPRIGMTATPMTRVVAIRLGAPPEPSPGAVAWLNDGTIIAGLTIADDTTDEPVSARRGPMLIASAVVSESDAVDVKIPLNDVDALLLDPSSLVALSALRASSQSPLGERLPDPLRIVGDARSAIAPPPPLGAADIVLPGPMEVRWTLPDNASRVAFDAVLPDSSHLWGNCDVAVLVEPHAGPALASFTLTGAAPAQRVNVALPAPDAPGAGARTLVVRLEPGRFGPIQDRVEIRRGLLLLGDPSTAP